MKQKLKYSTNITVDKEIEIEIPTYLHFDNGMVDHYGNLLSREEYVKIDEENVTIINFDEIDGGEKYSLQVFPHNEFTDIGYERHLQDTQFVVNREIFYRAMGNCRDFILEHCPEIEQFDLKF